MQLTDTQQAILGMIAEHIARDGLPPSQTEIARAFGFKGVRAAQYHLEALEQAGAIRRVPGQARGIRLLRPPVHDDVPAAPAPGNDVLHLPSLGRVAAGLPIGAVDAVEDGRVSIKPNFDRSRLEYVRVVDFGVGTANDAPPAVSETGTKKQKPSVRADAR